ncbi:uncharacterized protein LOC124866100 isoform X1 [Girardinichthys multiradiatus]|uniref:uncharacterized protein LOC124866100 isoform X1 n=1 Tax=Girardinichthys multiradiatus TaxID=208333 RepID=UPI001FAB78E2|nr:uncharacterized protein LOC124866100 isoform X1 [Girardinichthys multiradiatus]
MEGPEHVSAESLETRGQVRLLLQRILGSKGDLKSKPQSSCNLLALAPGDFKSKLQSSCNSQPWLQVPALHPAKVKFPSSQGIYLDQVLADSSKPLSSKRTLLTLHQPTIHHQLPRISSGNQIHRIKSSRSHLKPYLKKLTTTLDYHRLSSSLTALPYSTSLFLIKLTSIHNKPKFKIVSHLFPKHNLRLLTSCVSPIQSAVFSPGSGIHLLKKLANLFSCLLSVSLYVGRNN